MSDVSLCLRKRLNHVSEARYYCERGRTRTRTRMMMMMRRRRMTMMAMMLKKRKTLTMMMTMTMKRMNGKNSAAQRIKKA
jgi:hypothetical protein